MLVGLFGQVMAPYHSDQKSLGGALFERLKVHSFDVTKKRTTGVNPASSLLRPSLHLLTKQNEGFLLVLDPHTYFLA